jgi:phosphoribosyl-AMP cyclohydrolase
LPVVAQDAATGDVLTLAYANREAVEKTISTGEAHYFSAPALSSGARVLRAATPRGWSR